MSRITTSPIISAAYPPHLAEQGKYVALDNTTLTDYPSGGTGKYAELVWVVNQSQGGTTSTATIITTAGIALSASNTAVERTIQNLSTAPLFVRRGTGASATVFDWILPACTAADDGTSSPIVIDNYFGIISVYGTTVRCVVAELK